MNTSSRVGILGGTFDPIHDGHLAAAEAARVALALTDILVVPSHHPPHRSTEPRASGYHRFAMAALAVSPRTGFSLADIELGRDRPSYTATTLTLLGEQGFATWQLFFIAGADAFAEIATWHRYPAVLDLSHFVVVSRPRHPSARLEVTLPHLAARMVHVGRGRPVAGAFEDPRIFLVDAETPDVSSTEIRGRVRRGEPLTDLVPAAVARYIMRQHLYEAAPSTRVVDDLHERAE